MRHDSSSPSPTSWLGFKELAKTRYDAGDYEGALAAYCGAINPELSCPASEKQILLSNMVACRLKIGGTAQAEAAVENAKQCIAINDRWAKGHVRLASAYIALGTKSNDACNSLQRALQLDPSNPTARQMLVQELRRDRYSNVPQPSAPPQEYDIHRESSSTASSPRNNNLNPNAATHSHRPAPSETTATDQEIDIDDSLSWADRLSFYFQKASMWYQSQSDDVRTVMKVFLVLIVLYVALGGRFGLEYASRKQSMGNYGAGNAYDRYYGGSGASSSSHSDPSNSNRHHHYETGRSQDSYRAPDPQRNTAHNHGSRGSYHDSSYDGYDYYGRSDRTRSRSSRGSSFHFPNLFDGSLQSMSILAGIAYLAHRNGVNPMQALFFLNLLGGGRRRRGGFGGGFGGGAMRYGRGRARWY